MEIFDYVILGAGLGGLSVAACLACQGYKVVVLEQHYLPGGCCHTFDYGEYRFCADVHYIFGCAPSQTIARFLDFIEREVPFNSLDPDCIDRVILPGVDFRIPLGWENLRSRLLATFPTESGAINRYCDEIWQMYREMGRLRRSLNIRWLDWLQLPKYWHIFQKRNWTLQDLYDRLGLSPTLQGLLAGQSGDYGLPPEEVALLTHVALVGGYSMGAYYPKYHFKHFVDMIVGAIVANGGTIEYSTPVEHIEVKGGSAREITAGGRKYRATRAYISDLDPKLTVELMGDRAALSDREFRRLTDYEYSASAFNIYLGLHHTFNPREYGIGNWNIWYYPDGDLNRAYQQQLAGNFRHPWIFLSCPTMKSDEPGMAPPGNHVLEIATVCPYELFGTLRESDRAAYRAKKREIYEEIMVSVRDLVPDIDAHARMKVYGTPTTSEHFLGQPRGNAYGAKLSPRHIGVNRLGYETELPNFFFVGASAGSPSVPGAIGNGMDVFERLTGISPAKTIQTGTLEPAISSV